MGLLGDSQIGKTSLMVKYVEGSFEDSYIETLGVHFMDKIITLKNNKITFNIWDLGGNFLPLFPFQKIFNIASPIVFDQVKKLFSVCSRLCVRMQVGPDLTQFDSRPFYFL